MASANLLDLPVELLEALILYPNLTVPDICALSCVCWTLNRVVSRIWAKIAKSRWKYWGRVITTDGREGGQDLRLDWYQLCRQRYSCEIHTQSIIEELTKKGAYVLHMSGDELDCFADFLKKTKCPVNLFLCVLDSILHQDQKEANLTHQYYALFGKEYISWMALTENWRELLSQQDDPQLLEKGAILLSQWMNPFTEISACSIHQQLDSIAEQVATELLQDQQCHDGRDAATCPNRDKMDTSSVIGQSCDDVGAREDGSNHTAAVSSERLRRLGLPTEVVLDGINTVLYGRLHFSAPSMDQYYNLENSFIDKVLAQKKGLPITMCIVYQAVARRLGVTLRTINFPSHFLLQIPPEPGRTLDGSESIYVDAFARGVRRSYVECCSMINRVPEVEVADPMEVFMRMTANIYTQSHIFAIHNLDREFDKEINHWGPIALISALNLQLVLCSIAEVRPRSTVLHRALHLTHMCLELNYAAKKVTQVATRLKELTSDSQRLDRLVSRATEVYNEKERSFENPLMPKQRNHELSYKVGMIMKHRRYDYQCVIYGWDLTCQMSDTWIAQMGVDRLPNGRNQPFYNVLVEDGTNRYAAEENLFPCPQNELAVIEHWEIGRYFTSFKEDHYVPNTILKQSYPYD